MPQADAAALRCSCWPQVVCTLLATRLWLQQELLAAKARERRPRLPRPAGPPAAARVVLSGGEGDGRALRPGAAAPLVRHVDVQGEGCRQGARGAQGAGTDAETGRARGELTSDRVAAALTTCRRLGLQITWALAAAEGVAGSGVGGDGAPQHVGGEAGGWEEGRGGGAGEDGGTRVTQDRHGGSTGGPEAPVTGVLDAQPDKPHPALAAAAGDALLRRPQLKNAAILPALARVHDRQLRAALHALYFREKESAEWARVARRLQRERQWAHN